MLKHNRMTGLPKGNITTKHIILFLCFLLLIVNNSESADVQSAKPHVVLIVADDLGFNDVPWHNKAVVAPNLEKLANAGIILEQSYVQPICSPTRSALLTGRYPFTMGRQGEVIWPLIPTGLTLEHEIIPQKLKPLGYSTHAIGKWHLGFCKWAYTPTERGFDSFRGYYTGSEDYYTHIRHYDQKNLENNQEFENRKNTFDGYDFRDNRKPYLNASGDYSTYEFSSRFEDILRSNDSKTPKFIYMAFQSVHSPLQVPERFLKPYLHIKDKHRQTYLGMVSALDESIGKMVGALKETNHYNNTIIIFTTDNGGPTVTGGNNWPLRGNKTTMWEGGTRGAAFVHSPLLRNKGTVSRNLIHVTDWMSTIVHLTGGKPDKDLDGVNQWEALKESKPGPRKEMVYDFIHTNQKTVNAAYRYGKFKMILGYPGPGEWTPPPERNVINKEKSFSQITFGEHYKILSSIKKHCKTEKCLKKLVNSYTKLIEESNLPTYLAKRLRKLFYLHFKIYLTFMKTLDTRKFSEDPIDNEDKLDRMSRRKRSENFIDEFHLEKETDKNIEFSNETSKSLQYWMQEVGLKVRLFDVWDDPNEKNDLSKKNPDILNSLYKKFVTYQKKYKNPDFPPNDPKGSPKYFDGFWSPGWC